MLLSIIIAVIVAIIFFGVGFFTQKVLRDRKILTAEQKADKIITTAKEKSKQIEQQTTERLEHLQREKKREFTEETKALKRHLELWERDLQKKEIELKKSGDFLSQKEKNLMAREKEVQQQREEVRIKRKRYTQLIEESNQKLENISRMTREEAREVFLAQVKEETENKAIQIENEIISEAKKKGTRKAKEIITQAIQRCAAEHTSDTTVSVVSLPSESMKGRIIGREGRNIRAFENTTGIDVIIDDTPETITLSSFDPIKREIARVSMENLVKDGRIHPARIEEIVKKVTTELEERILEIGEDTMFELGISNIHENLVRMVGRLNFRTSYSQNVLQHSREVAYLMSLMAGELDLDIDLATRAGILHDIGKGMTQDYKGKHAEIGAIEARKFGENPIVVNAIAAHHEEVEPTSPIAVLLQAADAISGARPGARRETLEAYIKRLEDLEKIASSFEGVKRVYSMQAGREIRIIVEPQNITDNGTRKLALNVAQRIEQELKYPGEIKVTVIRETRAVTNAK
ncbi:ribonuclease Y [candidate division WOR-3 bacterium]|nr:ribonuclease Y [candidate division WOR-3 bacterium]MCK4526887.1 ribonuclease Y [candidate division WOR-3 bacterium]